MCWKGRQHFIGGCKLRCVRRDIGKVVRFGLTYAGEAIRRWQKWGKQRKIYASAQTLARSTFVIDRTLLIGQKLSSKHAMWKSWHSFSCYGAGLATITPVVTIGVRGVFRYLPNWRWAPEDTVTKNI